MAETAPTKEVVYAEESCLYELVPLLPLPQVDLSVSVKSRFIHNQRIHRLIRALALSPLTFVGYMIYLGVGIAVFYVPARIGQILSVMGLAVGIPGALIPLGNLRYDMVVVMLKTYDMWFSAGVSTIVTVLLGMLLNDARAALMILSWISFMINVGVDASVSGLRRIWIGNIFSAICYTAMAAAVSIQFTDGLNVFQIVRINGHELPAATVVRDCLVTMIIVIGRNIARKYKHAINEDLVTTTATLFRCVSFRCRLQFCQATNPTSSPDLSRPNPALPESHGETSDSTKVQLLYMPDLQLIDVRDTLGCCRWLWSGHSRGSFQKRTLLPWLGVTGFVVTNVIYLTNVASPHQWHQHVQLPIIIVATSASTTFVAVTVASMHRQLLRAISTSFDFLFIIVEITIVHLALADILGWHMITVLALFSDLQWCVWILCWDAITPPVRRRLKLSRYFAGWIGLSLMVVLASVAAIVLLLKTPDAIQDRVIYRVEVFNQVVEFRSLTWYFSCVATISSWALRVVWRLSRASENELVVLDGTVVYENHAHRTRRSKPSKQQVDQSPGDKKAAPALPSAAFAVIPIR